MLKYFVLFILFIHQVAMGQDLLMSYVAPTRVLRAKGYQIEGNADFFKTSKMLSEKGESEALPEGQSFSRIQGSFAGYYGATNDLQFGGGVRFRQNQAKFLDGTEEIAATGTGLESVFASLKFAFKPVDRMQYTLEGLFRYRTYSNDEFDIATGDKESLVLGDVGNEISVGAGMTYSSRTNNFVTLRGGYRSAGSDISDEIYYQLEAAMAWRYFALVAGVDGTVSLGNDPFEGDEASRPIYNTGGTFLYNSKNREVVAPYAGINIGLGDHWRVELRGAQVVMGKSTDAGTSFGVSLIRRFEKSDVRFVDNKFKTYDLEANVTKVSPKKNYVVIDKGLGDDFTKGMNVDLFEFDYVGGNVLVASGVVAKVKSDSAIVKITQRYNKKKEIKEGLVVRGRMK